MSTCENYYDTSPSCYEQGYNPKMAWSDFDYVMSCYTDSASAATAMSTGVKTKNVAIGGDMDRQSLVHAMQVAETKDKSTGVVTSVQFTHATPADFVAYRTSRNYYEAIGKRLLPSNLTGYPFLGRMATIGTLEKIMDRWVQKSKSVSRCPQWLDNR